MTIPSKLYDPLKWVAMVLLPALAVFYYAVGLIWGFPDPEKIVATINAADLFLGAILGISSAAYKKSDARFDGTMSVIKTDPSLINQLEIKTAPEQLAKQNEITFKVEQVDIPLPSPPRS